MFQKPLHEYRSRLEARRASRDALSEADERLSYARLATFVAAVFLAVLGWRAGLSFWWLAIPVTIFPWLVRRHDRVVRERAAAMRGMAFYERGLARLEDRWVGTGSVEGLQEAVRQIDALLV